MAHNTAAAISEHAHDSEHNDIIVACSCTILQVCARELRDGLLSDDLQLLFLGIAPFLNRSKPAVLSRFLYQVPFLSQVLPISGCFLFQVPSYFSFLLISGSILFQVPSYFRFLLISGSVLFQVPSYFRFLLISALFLFQVPSYFRFLLISGFVLTQIPSYFRALLISGPFLF